jgi:D-tyrosyl-tRNA(Tyr) deacylase
MRAVIQRVSRASVTIDGLVKSSIGHGLLILLGIEQDDNLEEAQKLALKIAKLRIFSDHAGLMNVSVTDAGGGLLVISQGNRPSFIRAARPEQAIPLYEAFIRFLHEESGREVQTGEFGADMKVDLLNDGPVTILIDTKNWE